MMAENVLSNKLLEEIEGRIAWSKASREQYENEWDEALRYYIGAHWEGHGVSVHDPLVVNKFWPLVQAAIPKLFFRAPYVFVKPTQKYATRTGPDGQEYMVDLEANSRSAEALTNRIWRNRSMHWMMRQLIVDSYIYGVGIVKVGYSSEHGVSKQEAIETQLPPDMDELRSIFPNMTEDDFYRISGQDKLLDFDSNIQPGHPWVKRVSPMDFWVDPDSDDLESARFVIHKVRRQLRTVQADPLYSGTRNLMADSVNDDSGADAPGNPSVMWPSGVRSNMSVPPRQTDLVSGDPVDMISLYEYWDRERLEIYTLARQASGCHSSWKCIRRVPEWPYRDIRGFPFKALRMNVVPNRFYSLTGISQWIEQQKELNLYRSIMADHVRRHGRKIFVKPNFFQNKEEKAKCESPGAGIIVECNDPDKGWKPMEFGAVSPDLYRMESAIRNDIGEATLWSSSPNAQGQPNPRITSATEASIMQGSQATMTDDQLNLVTEFASDFTRDLFLIYRQFWTGEQVIQYTSRVQGKEWVEVNQMTLRGEYDFVIEVGSTQKQSNEAKQQRAIQLLQLFMNPQIMQMYGPEVVKNMITRTLRAFEIDNPDEIFRGAEEWIPPDVRAQMDQKRAEAEASQFQVNVNGGPPGGSYQPNQSGGGSVVRTPPGGTPTDAGSSYADAIQQGVQ